MTISTRTRSERTRCNPPEESRDALIFPVSAEMRDCVVVEIPRRPTKRDLSTRAGSSPFDTPRKRRTTGPAITTPAESSRKSKSPLPGIVESRLSPAMTPAKITTNRSNHPHGEDESLRCTSTLPELTSKSPAAITIHAREEDGNPFISSSVSREVFLSNEALRRQREARNFQFVGDHMAPVALRSGKTMVRRGVHELDEYGDVVNTPTVYDGGVERDEREATNDVVGVEEAEYHIPLSLDNTAVSHTAPGVPSLDNKISSLYSHLVSRLANAALPTVTEMRDDKTGVMQEAISLLMGTVEKGEGNSCLLIGARGSGKTRTINAAIESVCRRRLDAPKPIVVLLSGLIHSTDRLAIREMGRQINEAEERAIDGQDLEEEGGDGDFAPTTLPSHLLAQLTMPSPRAVVVVIDHFDLFTEHPRQALLYCLLDVAQSINTGLGSHSGRGIAVVGLTSRVDTLLLLEKRVKSRFSHRILRVPSPLTTMGGWLALLKEVFLSPSTMKVAHEGWEEHANMLLADARLRSRMDLLAGLTTDVRVLFRPVISCLTRVAVDRRTTLCADELLTAIDEQIHLSGWGNVVEKLKGLPHPALAILIIGKHLAFAGREEFNFAQVEAEYQRFSRTKLVGSGKTRWSSSVLRKAFDQLVSVHLLVSIGPSRSAANHANPRFARVRSLLQPYEVVQYFKGQGCNTLSVELGNWGRMMGGHA